MRNGKKTKLTISGNPKKSFKNFAVEKTKGEKTVIIGKNSERPSGKGTFNKPSINNLFRIKIRDFVEITDSENIKI